MDDLEAPFEAPHYPSQRVHPSASANMGSLLLQGWTMLADSCPVCGVPLMRRDTETVCVNCSQSPAPPPPPAAAPLPNGNGLHHSDSSGDSDVDDGVVAAPPPLRQRLREGPTSVPAAQRTEAAAEDATQLIADRMLQGWALLADHCPQ